MARMIPPFGPQETGSNGEKAVFSILARSLSDDFTVTVKLDGFTTLNLKAVWRPMKNLSAEAGVNNVTDKNYDLDYGFPAAGHMWFANLSYQF